MPLSIRFAVPGDIDLIDALVRELATYEKLLDEVAATPSLLGEALFADRPRVFCDIVEWRDDDAQAPHAAGFAVWFYNFSTFRGRHGIYLEDLFVRPAFRGRGIGQALMANLARRCQAEGLARLEWSVLDWNEPAIAFYRSQGAVLKDGWTTCRLAGEALARLAAHAQGHESLLPS